MRIIFASELLLGLLNLKVCQALFGSHFKLLAQHIHFLVQKFKNISLLSI